MTWKQVRNGRTLHSPGPWFKTPKSKDFKAPSLLWRSQSLRQKSTTPQSQSRRISPLRLCCWQQADVGRSVGRRTIRLEWRSYSRRRQPTTTTAATTLRSSSGQKWIINLILPHRSTKPATSSTTTVGDDASENMHPALRTALVRRSPESWLKPFPGRKSLSGVWSYQNGSALTLICKKK